MDLGLSALHRCFLSLGLLVVVGAIPAVEEVPREVADLVATVQEQLAAENVTEARASLAEWDGGSFAVLALMRGYVELAAEDPAAAEAAFRQALELDPDLPEAGRALIRILVDDDRWAAARPLCGRFIDPSEAAAGWLQLFVQVAERSDDPPLAEELARIGMRRFPDDTVFRRLLVGILFESERNAEASGHLRYLLTRTPDDARLWRDFAASRQSDADAPRSRAALEAAVLADPDAPELLAHHVARQLEAGHHATALASAERLIALAPSAEHHLLAARSALAAADLERAAAWLAAIPSDEREREHHLLAARIALARDDLVSARAAFEALLTDPGLDARVLLWAAQVERQAGATARAETLLRRAIARDDGHAATARLHLAHLLLGDQRYDEAASLLRDHLERHPGDDIARRMLALAEERG